VICCLNAPRAFQPTTDTRVVPLARRKAYARRGLCGPDHDAQRCAKERRSAGGAAWIKLPSPVFDRAPDKLTVGRPFALGRLQEREAFAFVANLGICDFRHEVLSHCLKSAGQALVGARRRETQARVSLVSIIGRTLHRTPHLV
jgi:hypothetical protein